MRLGVHIGVASAILVSFLGVIPIARAQEWVDSMNVVNDAFTGTEFYAGKAGASTFTSTIFWGPLARGSLDLAGNPWDDEVAALTSVLIEGVSAPEYSSLATKVGGSSSWVLSGSPSPLDELLAHEPEVAIIMFGTNDVFGTDPTSQVHPSFKANMINIVQQTLAANCIPLLTTIHPQVDRLVGIEAVNTIIRELADSANVPLNDFYQAVIDRHPADWDTTLLAPDGVHLSADGVQPDGGAGNFGVGNLSEVGYALLNYSTLAAFSQIYDLVLTDLTVGVPADGVSHGGVISLAPVNPTPMRAKGQVSFTVSQPGRIRLAVYDVAGRSVIDLVDTYARPGTHRLSWNGMDSSGRRLASGVYLLKLSAGGQQVTRRVLLVR